MPTPEEDQNHVIVLSKHFPTLQQSEEEELAHPEWSNVFIMADSGSSSVSFVQLLFELCKFEPRHLPLDKLEEPQCRILFCIEPTTD